MMQVLFTGEKVGVGMGKTRKDAQQQAAENALRSLAGKNFKYPNLFVKNRTVTWLYITIYYFLYIITNVCCAIIAEKYVAYFISQSETVNKDPDMQANETEIGFLWESDSDESESHVKDAENSSEVGYQYWWCFLYTFFT